jgi:hypothetical protein
LQASARSWQTTVIFVAVAYVHLILPADGNLTLTDVFISARTRAGATFNLRDSALPQSIRDVEPLAATIIRFLLQSASLYTPRPVRSLTFLELQRYEELSLRFREFTPPSDEFKEATRRSFERATRANTNQPVVDLASNRMAIIKYLLFQIISGRMGPRAVSQMVIRQWGTRSIREVREQAIAALRTSVDLSQPITTTDTVPLSAVRLPDLFPQAESDEDESKEPAQPDSQSSRSSAPTSRTSVRARTSSQVVHFEQDFAVMMNFLGFFPDDLCFLCHNAADGRAFVCPVCYSRFHLQCFCPAALRRAPSSGGDARTWNHELLVQASSVLRLDLDEVSNALNRAKCWRCQETIDAGASIFVCPRCVIFVCHPTCFRS